MEDDRISLTVAQYAIPATLVVWFFQKLYRIWTDPLSKVPGPWYASWTSAVNTFTSLTGQNHVWTHKLHEKYGPVVRIKPNEVAIRSPSGAAQIHQIKRPFLKAPFYREFLPDIENVFSTIDTDFHRRHRRLLSAPLSETQLQTVFLPRIEAHFDVAFAKMRRDLETKGYVDVCKWFLYTATDVIGELSFGDSFHMLEKDEVNQYIRDLSGQGIARALRFALGTLVTNPVVAYLPLFREATAAGRRSRAFASESLARHKKVLERRHEAGVYPTLFDKLYKEKAKKSQVDGSEEETLSNKELVDEATGYIVAGSDTTSVALTYLVWAVCRHPRVQAELVAEVATLADDFTQQDLKDLKFLNLVIQETLRLYASAPGALPRVVPPGGAEIDGYWFPGGVTVSTMAYALHRDPAVFAEPEKFDPWRWEASTKEMKDAWMPFGGGTRTCVGIHLAYIELRLGVARFFREFPNARVSTKEGMSDADMEQQVFFLLAPKGHRCLIEA